MAQKILLYIIFALLFAQGPLAFAQADSADNAYLREIDYSKIEGSPYSNDSYQWGVLMHGRNKKIGKYKIRYNAHIDRMETLNADGTIGVISKADSLNIVINNTTYLTLDYLEKNDKIHKGYFTEKTTGPSCSLFLREYKTIKEGKEASTGYHKNKPSKFIDHKKYYLRFSSKILQPIKLKKKAILNSFPKHYDLLNKYVSEKKLAVDSENGLIALVDYYNDIAK
ncbi:MAG: hypothetical protein WBM53_02310 [Maribacter sp.]